MQHSLSIQQSLMQQIDNVLKNSFKILPMLNKPIEYSNVLKKHPIEQGIFTLNTGNEKPDEDKEIRMIIYKQALIDVIKIWLGEMPMYDKITYAEGDEGKKIMSAYILLVKEWIDKTEAAYKNNHEKPQINSIQKSVILLFFNAIIGEKTPLSPHIEWFKSNIETWNDMLQYYRNNRVVDTEIQSTGGKRKKPSFSTNTINEDGRKQIKDNSGSWVQFTGDTEHHKTHGQSLG